MSTLSLACQVGGALGAAAFGAIFASRLAPELASRLPADAPPRLSYGGPVTPEVICGLPRALQDSVTAGYAVEPLEPLRDQELPAFGRGARPSRGIQALGASLRHMTRGSGNRAFLRVPVYPTFIRLLSQEPFSR